MSLLFMTGSFRTFHPTAKPMLPSTYRAQNWGIAPGRGSHVAISPNDCICFGVSASHICSLQADQNVVYHGEDCNAGERISQQQRKRPSLGKGFPNAQEQSSANGSSQSDELDMARFQTGAFTSVLHSNTRDQLQFSSIPSRHVSIVFCRGQIAV